MAPRNVRIVVALIATLASALCARADQLETAKESIRLKEFSTAAAQLSAVTGKGQPAAQYLLGTLYLNGLGVAADANKARQLFELAANQAEPRAAFALSAMLANDEPRDLASAQRWLDRAAELRFPPAVSLRKEGKLPFDTKESLNTGDVDLKREMARLAAAHNDADTLKVLLNAATIKDSDEFGRTLLHRAAENGALSTAALLIKEHANVDAIDQFGVTPLMLAATSTSNETVQALLSAHANAKAVDRAGNTALFYAARADRVDHIKSLLASGVDAFAKNGNGWSAIDYAAQANAKNAVSYLQSRGATLVRHAAAASVRNSGEIQRAQGKFPDLYAPWSDLAIAVSRDDPALVQSLLERGAKIDGDAELKKLLMVAAIAQAPKSAAMLLSAREKERVQSADALNVAIKHGNVELVRALLNGGANMQADGSALLIAIRSNQPTIAAALLEAGANANASDNEGTALTMAAQRGQPQMLQALLAAHADVNRADKSGRSALWYAASAGHADAVEVLLKHQASIDAADNDSTTPLLRASSQGHVRVVEMLLAANANARARTKQGDTALSLAAAAGHVGVAQKLIAANSDLNAQSTRGDTALICASRAGHEQIVSALLQAGASSKLRNNEKMSAEDVAQARGFEQIAKLIEKG